MINIMKKKMIKIIVHLLIILMVIIVFDVKSSADDDVSNDESNVQEDVISAEEKNEFEIHEEINNEMQSEEKQDDIIEDYQKEDSNENASNLSDYRESNIETNKKVTSIEVEKAFFEIAVGDSDEIAASVYPIDATNQSIRYTSMNSDIATVSKSGQIQAVSVGATSILLEADDVNRYIEVTVIKRAKKISTKKKVFVMKPGETEHIKARILPEDSNDQSIAFVSKDRSIAEVSDDGVIIATGYGTTAIILENKDITDSVTVIVNPGGLTENDSNPVSEEEQVLENESFDLHYISTDSYPNIATNVLYELYRKKQKLYISGEYYFILIDGAEIENPNNELNTDLCLTIENNDIKFSVNDKNAMPGPIYIQFSDEVIQGKNYLYIYDKAKDQYIQVKWDGDSQIRITTAGKYILSSEEKNSLIISQSVIVITLIVILFLVIVYVIKARKYWFW